MLHRLREYNQHRANCDYEPIQIGIGIDTGTLMLGIVGGYNRMDSTVMSDAVICCPTRAECDRLWASVGALLWAPLARSQRPC